MSFLPYARQWAADVPTFFAQPVRILRGYHLTYLRGDVLASLTVAAMLLPQAIAYTLIAELPVQMGLYAAVVAAVIGALWGSSQHLHTGPTNGTSLLVLAGLTAVALPNTDQYIAAAGVMAVWAGLIRLVMGLAKLGILVNFVSDSVVVGFTAGAGMLIGANQFRHLLRLSLPNSPSFFTTMQDVFAHLPQTHLPSLAVGLVVFSVMIVLEKIRPSWPRALIALVIATLIVTAAQQQSLPHGMATITPFALELPYLSYLPLLDAALIRAMAPSMLAVALIGLLEAASIARTVAAKSGQYLDSDQEFVGQGLANIAVGFLGGYPVAGSLTRSVVNYDAGARTQLASAFSGLWILLAIVLFAPAVAYMPRTALAAILIITGAKMINGAEIKRIWRTSSGDTAIMISTWVATLLLPLEFAVLTGVLISFGRFIAKTSTPGVYAMLPDESFAHFTYQPEKSECPQLGVITIMGSLYFGAAPYVENQIRRHMSDYPSQRFLLLRMHRVNHCDISGLHMLETIVKLYRQQGGDVFMVGVRDGVREKMMLSEFESHLGSNHFLEQDTAIAHIFHQMLNPAICVYNCPLRAWKECQNLPKSSQPIPLHAALLAPLTAEPVPHITPQELLHQLSNPNQPLPLLIDVREPVEFAESHLRHAQHIPMPYLIEKCEEVVPHDQEVIFICRTGRRSHQVVQILRHKGYTQVAHVAGGMVGLELADL